MDRPLVSVIMPAYNCEKYIIKALDSAFVQEVPIEVIVIDDASTDKTAEMLKKYQGRENLHVITNEKNMGVAASRNLGISKAVGEYVAFLDADDWWATGKLKAQLEVIKDTGVVICGTAREIVDEVGKSTGRIMCTKEKITYKMMLFQNWLNCSSVVVKTAVIKEFPMQYDDSHEDYIAWMKILQKYKEARGIDKPLLKYRLSAKGKSGSKQHSAIMMYKAYRHLGFSHIKAAYYFCAYSINGIRKYYFN